MEKEHHTTIHTIDAFPNTKIKLQHPRAPALRQSATAARYAPAGKLSTTSRAVLLSCGFCTITRNASRG